MEEEEGVAESSVPTEYTHAGQLAYSQPSPLSCYPPASPPLSVLSSPLQLSPYSSCSSVSSYSSSSYGGESGHVVTSPSLSRSYCRPDLSYCRPDLSFCRPDLSFCGPDLSSSIPGTTDISGLSPSQQQRSYTESPVMYGSPGEQQTYLDDSLPIPLGQVPSSPAPNAWQYNVSKSENYFSIY